MDRLLVKNIGILATPEGNGPKGGKGQSEIREYRNTDLLIEDGAVKDISEKIPLRDLEIIDAEGRLVTPGLVDGHTHMVFGGYREHEVPLKLAGASYLEILDAGGGIQDTVKKTREASADELSEKTERFIREMNDLGVTSCEIKTGYGIDKENEFKLLEVIAGLKERCADRMDIASTFMPAHVVLPEWKGNEAGYIRMCIDEMFPYVRENDLASSVDIFIEDKVFGYAEARTYLEAAGEMGFSLKAHADEIENIGGSHLAGELGALSCEHLINIDDEGIIALSEGGTVAMCLPLTSFYLDAGYAPVRRMIDAGIPVACATDFNPGSCPSLNMQLVMNLCYLRYRMTPEETLNAVTLNPAYGIGLGDRTGSIETGKQGDIVIWDAQSLNMLCYRLGSSLARHVVKKGGVIK